MADLFAVLTGIKDVLNDFYEGSGETIRATVEFDQIQTPVALVEPQSVDWATDLGRGHEQWEVTIRILLNTVNLRASQLERFKYLGGAREIKDVIEGAAELRDGTIAQDVFVKSAQNFGVWIYNDVAYEGVEFSLDVYA